MRLSLNRLRRYLVIHGQFGNQVDATGCHIAPECTENETSNSFNRIHATRLKQGRNCLDLKLVNCDQSVARNFTAVVSESCVVYWTYTDL